MDIHPGPREPDASPNGTTFSPLDMPSGAAADAMALTPLGTITNNHVRVGW